MTRHPKVAGSVVFWDKALNHHQIGDKPGLLQAAIVEVKFFHEKFTPQKGKMLLQAHWLLEMGKHGCSARLGIDTSPSKKQKKNPKPETKPLLKYKAKGIKQMQNHLKNLPMYWFHGLDTRLSSWLCSRSPKPAFFPLPHSVSEVQPGDARAGQLREQGLRMLHRWSRPEFSFYSNTGISFLKRKKKKGMQISQNNTGTKRKKAYLLFSHSLCTQLSWKRLHSVAFFTVRYVGVTIKFITQGPVV